MSARPASNHLGKRLQEWRLHHNLTLTQAAEILGVEPSTILRWEKSRVEPNARSRYRIRQVISRRRATVKQV